jgi:hypothetical protein
MIIHLLVLIGYQSIGQNSFEKLIARDEDQRIFDVVEDDDGNFVLVGWIRNLETDYAEGYLLKIDEFGNQMNEEVFNFNDTIGIFFWNIHFLNNKYYLLGSYGNHMWYLVMNKNLEILDEKILGIPPDSWFSYMNSIIDSDSNFVVTGYTTRPDTSTSHPYNMDSFFYKLSIEGDSLTAKFNRTEYHLTMSWDILEKPDSSGYFAYGFEYSSDVNNGQRIELSKEFDSLYVETIPYNIHNYCSSLLIDDTSILICGIGGDHILFGEYSLNGLTTTIENQPIHANAFKMDENKRDFSSFLHGVSKMESNIYMGGTSNFNYADPFYSEYDSWFHLIKINPDITPVWEYWYGGDAYYHLFNLIATSDGGCLMVGNRYDFEIQYLERDIYVVKVNSDGLIVWTQEIPIENRSVTIYPNPGSNQLNILTSNTESEFELINQRGQVIIKQSLIGSLTSINTEQLESGIYFYRLVNKSTSLIESGKYVKY